MSASRCRRRPKLCANPECTRCALCTREGLRNVGLPTRVWDGGYGKPRRKKALLIVGSHPGIQEDILGATFVGATGRLTNHTYVEAHSLHEHADVFLTNALRCAPRKVDSVTEKMLKACRPYLVEDVEALSRCYDEVILLLTGEVAVTAVMGEKVALARFPQGSTLAICSRQVVVFATMLAAVMLPHNDPSKIMTIREHLLLVWRYLKLGTLPMAVKVPPASKLVGTKVQEPSPSAKLLSLDIETYGYFKHTAAGDPLPPQTVFHPAKMLAWDGVLRRDIVQTCALAWRDRLGNPRAKLYRMWLPTDVSRLLKVLHVHRGKPILGQNIAFDIMCLRAWDDRFYRLLVEKNFSLYELQVVNFLQNDQRVERSLKSLSMVLSVANYQDEPVDIKRGERYDNPYDGRLWEYNAKDALATLYDYEFLVEAIDLWYGSDTDKWKPYSRQWYSRVVWLAIQMSENGVHFDLKKLRRVHRRNLRALSYIEEKSHRLYEWPLQGGGSGKAKSRIIPELLHEWEPADPDAASEYNLQIVQTKKGAISTCKENVWLLLGHIPVGHPDRGKVLCFRRYQKLSKVVDSYTGPMLHQAKRTDPSKVPDHNDALVDGVAYPSWHVVPSYASDDASDSDKPGGTSQCRIVPQHPALQTHPKAIKKCRCSRFPHGALLRLDESQSEIRVATSVFGDPVFQDLYERQARGEPVNVHADTASEIAGHPVTKESHPREYHAGKTVNFLVLFLGQWRAFQSTCRREVGWDVSDAQAKRIIASWDKRHPVFRRGQHALIRLAQERGHIEIPLVGAGRTFLGQVEKAYASNVVNLLVQAISGLLTQSAQITVNDWIKREGLLSLPTMNCYDEGEWDCPRQEVKRLSEYAYSVFVAPPVWLDLVRGGHLGDVPLDAEMKIVYNSLT